LDKAEILNKPNFNESPNLGNLY